MDIKYEMEDIQNVMMENRSIAYKRSLMSVIFLNREKTNSKLLMERSQGLYSSRLFR